MGYEMNVSDFSLIKTKPDFIHVDSMRMIEEWEDVGKEIDFTSNFYVATQTDDLLEDLNSFQKMGVRGYFTVYGEQGKWIKYVLDDCGVQEYNATLLWGDEIQAALIIGIEDIKGCLIDDIANPVAMEKVASIMDNKEWVQNIINIMQKRLSLLDWNEVLAEAISDNL